MSNIITSGTTFQNDTVAANIAAQAAVTAARSANISAFDARSFAQQANLAAIRSANSATQAANSASLAATYATSARTSTGNVTNSSVINQPAGSTGWVQFKSGNGFSGANSFVFSTNGNVLSINGSISTGNLTSNGFANLNTVTIANANINGTIRSNSLSVLGNIISNGNLSVLGQITGTFTGNGSGLTGVALLNSPVFTGTPLAPTAGFNTNNTQIATTAFVQQAISNFTGISGNTFSVTGNIITSNNVVASGGLTATGNITGGNLRTAGLVSVTGGVTAGGNLIVGGNVQATGNITVARVIASGNITGTNVVANGNVTIFGNISMLGIIQASGLTSNNVNTINSNVTNTLSVSGGIKQNQFTKTGSSAGQPGQIVWDTNYIYVCTATNVWKRVALLSF